MWCSFQIVFDVDARDAAAALLERCVVAGGLRADQAAEAERLAGDRELVARVVDDLEEEPRVRAALVQLAGRVQVARAVAVRHDETAAAAQLDDEIGDAAVVLGGRLDERLHADVVALLRLREQRRRSSPSSSTSGSPPAASTSFVLSFAAWTSGWSNGLIPRYAPATATANSQRKNSPPSAYGSATCGTAACRSGPSGDSPGAGTSPLPCLPVDSAISCSAQRPKLPSVSAMQILSRPSLPAGAELAAELVARVRRRPAGRASASARRSRAGGRRRRPSAPRAPCRTARARSSGRRSSARRENTRRKPRSAAVRSSSEPGSVMATKYAPRLPERSQK